MRDLKFEGLSADGARLVLVGKDGQRWSVLIDERIEAAVRRDRARLAQVEIEQSGQLRPKEIQARIRAGATPEDVAAASGLAIERVLRFVGPVLTERDWMARKARAVLLRRPDGQQSLGELVTDRLTEQGVEPGDLIWDSWRREDGTWLVIATFPVGPNQHVATWAFDPTTNSVTPQDDNAAQLVALGAPALRLVLDARPPRSLAAVAPLPQDAGPEGLDGDAPAAIGVGEPQLRAVSVHSQSASEVDETRTPTDVHSSLATDAQPDAATDRSEPPEGTEASPEHTSDDPDPAAVLDEAPVPAPFPGETVQGVDIEAAQDVDPETAQDAQVETAQVVDDSGQPDATAQPDQPAAGTPESTAPGEGAADDGLFEVEPAVPARPRPTGGRSAIPSFDDILFGPKR